MVFHWSYPVYLIPHAGGYASVVGAPTCDDDRTHFLVVHTDEQPATEFMQRFEIEGRPKRLHNHREFRWLLLSLRDPVRHVAFDPDPDEGQVNARWSASVGDLLRDHLKADYSPWNYPVCVVAQEDGFASIQGSGPAGEPLTAICVFTDEEKAHDYLAAAGEVGSLCTLDNPDQARTFLAALGPGVSAVALDPRVEAGLRTARHGFSLQTLLDKYLKGDE